LRKGIEKLYALLVIAAPFISEDHLARGSLEQPDPQRALKASHRAAHSRSREVKGGGRADEAAGAHDRNECFDTGQRNHALLISRQQ